MDLKDAKCVLADLVSKSCAVAFTRQISDEVGEEGGVPRLGEVDLRPEAGQAGQSGSTTCAHDVDEAALYDLFQNVGRPLVSLQRSAPSREASTKNQGLGHPPDPAP